MTLIFFLVTFIFGTFIGSFLNVIIFRFNTNHHSGGRSKCMSCGKTLRAHELIPVISYAIQGGKCRNCKATISPQYPIVEAITGLLFALVFWQFRFFLVSFYSYYLLLVSYCLLIFSILTVIFFYDLKHKIIPNSLVYAFIGLSFFSPFIFSNLEIIPYSLSLFTFISGPLIALPLFALWLGSRGKWIGFGDVKFAVGMGYFLGLSAGFAALMLSFWVGALYGILLLIFKGKKYSMKSEIPFAPFLIIGLLLSFFLKIDIAWIANILS